jgi:hypothetical protein
MESPPTASGEKPMPQIIAPGAPPPNPQVIAGDSTEIAEDSRAGGAHGRTYWRNGTDTPFRPSGWGRGSSGRGRALGAAGIDNLMLLGHIYMYIKL